MKRRRSTLPTAKQATARLRFWLFAFFVCLAIPFYLLVSRVYNQLEQEALFQYRAAAEEVVDRIEQRISAVLEKEEQRPFEEYSFFNIAENTVLRSKQLVFSPLASLPPQSETPGVIGYFQVTPEGELESPAVPAAVKVGGDTPGVSREELQQRFELKDRLALLLNKNAPGSIDARANNANQKQQTVARERNSDSLRLDTPSVRQLQIDELVATESRGAEETKPGDGFVGKQPTVPPPASAADSKFKQSYLALFDEQKESAPTNVKSAAKELSADADYFGQPDANEARGGQLVEKGALNSRPAEKTEVVTKKRKVKINLASQSALGRAVSDQQQVLFQEKNIPLEKELDDSSAVAGAKADQKHIPDKVADKVTVDLLTFEGEIDPLQFRVLDRDYFLFFRRAWKNKQRFIQGFVVKKDDFMRELVEKEFNASSIGSIATLDVSYNGVLFGSISNAGVSGISAAPLSANLASFRPQTGNRYQVFSRYLSDSSPEYDITFDKPQLIFRRYLSTPLDTIGLAFSVLGVTFAPGATTVVSLLVSVVSVVLVLGLLILYRFGIGQISFAQERGNFVSAISHELKTPLTSIRMYGEMLRSGYVESEAKRKEYYDFIFFESERLSRLIANVLQLARLTNSEATLDLKPFSPHTLIDLVQSKISTQCTAANFELEVIAPDDAADVKIKADEDALVQIFINLVDNAIKFSAASDQKKIAVGFRLRQSGAMAIEFFVRDYGPGIPKGQMKKIFQLFYRTEDELTRKTKGTGIGLALVSQLATSMGAQVDLKNCSLGAEFSVRFESC